MFFLFLLKGHLRQEYLFYAHDLKYQFFYEKKKKKKIIIIITSSTTTTTQLLQLIIRVDDIKLTLPHHDHTVIKKDKTTNNLKNDEK